LLPVLETRYAACVCMYDSTCLHNVYRTRYASTFAHTLSVNILRGIYIQLCGLWESGDDDKDFKTVGSLWTAGAATTKATHGPCHTASDDSNKL